MRPDLQARLLRVASAIDKLPKVASEVASDPSKQIMSVLRESARKYVTTLRHTSPNVYKNKVKGGFSYKVICFESMEGQEPNPETQKRTEQIGKKIVQDLANAGFKATYRFRYNFAGLCTYSVLFTVD